MSWKFVFNSRYLTAGTDIITVKLKAKSIGYKFFLFNGIVYFIADANIYDTGIKVEDLY